jgi:hypothetical protein
MKYKKHMMLTLQDWKAKLKVRQKDSQEVEQNTSEENYRE